jgi:DNA polymerase IV
VIVLHADMDAFYASIEQRDRPELRGLPVVVGGPSARGVVSAASYEARRFGVHSAMPTAHARKLCPQAVFLPGDMAKYRRVSREIRAVFDTISPAVEPLSLDEAFIDITGSTKLLGAPLEIGRLLRERVRTATGLAVSVGIGPGKMIAKIASDHSKPDGLLEVAADGVAAFLAPLPVGRLWGVGPVMQRSLAAAGIATIGALALTPRATLVRRIGARSADHLLALAHGQDARRIEPDREAKTFGEENTFGTDVHDSAVVRAAIVEHAEAVARRLRREQVVARTIVLKLKLAIPLGEGRFPALTRQTTLREPSADGAELATAALALWEANRPDAALRLVGVTAAGIVDGRGAQLDLFADGRSRQRTALNQALDTIVDRFGADSIHRGGGASPKISPTTRLKRGE